MAYKNEDFQSLNDLMVPHSLETFINDLPNRYENGEIDHKIEVQVEKDWIDFTHRVKKDKRKTSNKVVYFSIVIAASFCLFIGAAFTSPTVARIAAAIPYLHLVFEKKIEAKPLISEINEALFENGDFSPSNIVVSVNNTKQEVTVAVLDTEEYFAEVKETLQSIVEEVTKRNHKHFTVKIVNDPETGKFFKDSMLNPPEEDQEFEQVSAIVEDVLQSYGYSKGGFGVRLGRIDLENIPNTETRVKEIKTAIIEALRSENKGEYEVKVHLFDQKAREREGKFLPIYHTIHEGLTAKTEFYQFDSVGYSSKKDYFYIEVRTTVPSTYKDIEGVVNKLAQTIQEFLDSSEVKHQIQEEPYKIVIISTDKKELKVIQN
ncbi:hypothetical protein ACFSO7_08745 [Bacillus sp. CGMCC 1.16607]|uniref:hypothetical protein n=1 Tax=Bacillus sp. CGMCC 1.16607 TaxID=3351842 RepID=UPI0036305B23